jgi:hypothetical protein
MSANFKIFSDGLDFRLSPRLFVNGAVILRMARSELTLVAPYKRQIKIASVVRAPAI